MTCPPPCHLETGCGVGRIDPRSNPGRKIYWKPGNGRESHRETELSFRGGVGFYGVLLHAESERISFLGLYRHLLSQDHTALVRMT